MRRAPAPGLRVSLAQSIRDARTPTGDPAPHGWAQNPVSSADRAARASAVQRRVPQVRRGVHPRRSCARSKQSRRYRQTVNLIANSMLTLLRYPEHYERLRREPSIVANLVEEVLRYEPPVQFVRRTTLTEVPIAGVTIPK